MIKAMNSDSPTLRRRHHHYHHGNPFSNTLKYVCLTLVSFRKPFLVLVCLFIGWIGIISNVVVPLHRSVSIIIDSSTASYSDVVQQQQQQQGVGVVDLDDENNNNNNDRSRWKEIQTESERLHKLGYNVPDVNTMEAYGRLEQNINNVRQPKKQQQMKTPLQTKSYKTTKQPPQMLSNDTNVFTTTGVSSSKRQQPKQQHQNPLQKKQQQQPLQQQRQNPFQQKKQQQQPLQPQRQGQLQTQHVQKQLNRTIVGVARNDDNNNNNTISTPRTQSIIEPRIYDSWPKNQRLPCYPAETNWNTVPVQNTPSSIGFLYLKPYKTGSSTGSGIAIRIARNVAKRQKKNYTFCKVRYDHGPDIHPGRTLFRETLYHNYSAYLWTILREPTARAISSFFHFFVSRQGMEPTDENFIHISETMYGAEDYYYHAMYHDWYGKRTYHDPIDVGNTIMNKYNFIGITERMDESVVVLMMLLNLKIGDILYLSAKTNGGYDDGGGETGCVLIQKSFVSSKMKDYFASKRWQSIVQYDVALYQAANASMELTIDFLGRQQFEQNLHTFQQAQQIINERCLPQTRFPCNKDGWRRPENQTDCFWNDSGCGYACLDEVATELKLW